jgi:ATP-dependent Clp protease ATP-binding subunit ClpC
VNRLDSVVVFRALNRTDIREIVSLELRKVSERLEEYELTLQASEAALDYLADEGFDPEMGARPVRRVIEQMVEEPLSDALLAHTFTNGDSILVDLEESLDADGDKVRKIVLKRREAQSQPDNPEKVGA